MVLLKSQTVLNNLVRFSSFSYKSLSKESKVLIDRILRVDHAGMITMLSQVKLKYLKKLNWLVAGVKNLTGEFGADRIYAGQMAVLGKSPIGPVIQVIYCNILPSI